ncbi:MAG: hypothetical protein OXN88_14025 [Chloroflexota bacterium]|nr:hypothetical protein [Chloroflexota bacterium]
MKIPLMVTADYATVDPITGKLHILGVFRNIYANGFPTKHPRMCLALIIEGELADSKNPHDLTVTMADEDGVELFSMKGAFDMPKSASGIAPHCNVLMEFNDLKFEKAGQYRFYVTVNTNEIEDSTVIQVVQNDIGNR